MDERPDDIDTIQDTASKSDAPPDPMIGKTVDQYTIRRVIGSGGMGVVYEAVQKSPRRSVALKMMKNGVTSKSALRRFEYEAQTLGRLRHEGIAQIFEAGTWDEGSGGRPWFAMEYLPGATTITRYCEETHLGTRERLTLFAKVCAAVQHGHAKGIIHRDLKPSNILVTSSGVPKVIDFGVARSTDSDLAVTTLQTDVGALIGTMQYMSPEQCAADPNDIDIRSDVYSLGVIFYELLCKRVPYDVARVALHEAVRIVREDEPRKLSTIDRHLRGDIETIAVKALEKQRDRRYQSATALQEDIRRYLADEPIAARPPGALDYLRRFTRKYTAAAAAIVAVFIVLVLAIVAVTIFAVETASQRAAAIQERDRAEAVQGFVTTMLSSMESPEDGDWSAWKGMLFQAANAIEHDFNDQPVVEADLRLVIAKSYRGIGAHEEAEGHLVRALFLRQQELGDEHLDTLAVLPELGLALMGQGKLAEMERHVQDAMETGRRVLDEGHPVTLKAIGLMGALRSKQGRFDEAEQYFLEALEVSRRVLGNDHERTFAILNNLGSMLQEQGRLDDAQRHLLEALALTRRTLGDDAIPTAIAMTNLGALRTAQGRHEESLALHQEALDITLRSIGGEHPRTIAYAVTLSAALGFAGKHDEALAVLEDGLDAARRTLGEGDVLTGSLRASLGELLVVQGRFAEADEHLNAALDTCRAALGETHPITLATRGVLANSLWQQDRFEDAEPHVRAALTGARLRHGDDHPQTLACIVRLSRTCWKRRKIDEAERYAREALERYRRVLGDEHPDTLAATDNLTQMLVARKGYSGAQGYVLGALDMAQRAIGRSEPSAPRPFDDILLLFDSWNE